MAPQMLHRILFWSEGDWPQKHEGTAKTFPKKAVKAVVEHLKAGRVHRTLETPATCWVCGVDLGSCEMTDGQVVWPDKAHHYVTVHHVWSPEHAWLADRLLLDSEEPPPAMAAAESAGATPDATPDAAVARETPANGGSSDAWCDEAALDAMVERALAPESGPARPPGRRGRSGDRDARRPDRPAHRRRHRWVRAPSSAGRQIDPRQQRDQVRNRRRPTRCR